MPIALNGLLLILVGSVGAYLCFCLLLYLRQTRRIFFPSPVIETTPAELGLPYEEVWLPVGGERLHGWWIPAAREKGAVLYLHGNAINIGANIGQAERFHRLGLSVLLIDYRGYGRSEGGFPTERRVYQDAEASWRYLMGQVSPDRLFIYGHSLGGAIAIELASHHPEAAGLIVQSSFTSMRQMIDYVLPRRIFPADLLLTQRFDSLSKISALKLPILLIHGLTDEKVPAFMSEILYAAAPEPKQLYLVPLADHNNVGETAGDDYLQVVQQFVQQSLEMQLDYSSP
jgi:fermentation-respiration switch protein FrsA (DUF1100 family)